MNIHEYQAKEILKRYGVKVPMEIVASTVEEAVEAAKKISAETGSNIFAVKAQIHAGGRGKGGGVKIAKSLDEVKTYASQILGMTLVTPQTGPEGKFVRKILIAQNVYYDGPSKPQEFYMGVLLDRATSQNIIMASTEGGMEIEEVAEHSPEKIIKARRGRNPRI